MIRISATVAGLGVVCVLAGCGGGGREAVTTRPVTPSTTANPIPAAPLRHWRGPVEHLFFHPLVSSPNLALTSDPLGQGFKDYFIDVREFRRIMPQLYRHGWVLVDIHAVASGRLLVPVGKKPLLLSIDDLNYNGYMRERGTGWRLILDRSGNVQVEERTSDGHRRGSRMQEIVPLLDDFVTAHPDFSLNGAKGVIAETGYSVSERTSCTRPISPHAGSAFATWLLA